MRHSFDIRKYLAHSKKIEGWFDICDALIFENLLKFQLLKNLLGSVVEIGVHQGKSFIPLALSNTGKNAYVIDVFDNQLLNRDHSGKGNQQRFIENLCYWQIDPKEIILDARRSEEVKPVDILETVGSTRFFHIDGGHHFAAVSSDLKLAQLVMANHGIIAIDDVFRPEWPEVSFALFSADIFLSKEWVPFAIGYNKTYLCKPEFAELYRTALLEDKTLTWFLNKTYAIDGIPILVYQTYLRSDFGLYRRLIHNLRLFSPSTWLFFMKLKKKIKEN